MMDKTKPVNDTAEEYIFYLLWEMPNELRGLYCNSSNYFLQPWWAEEHLRMQTFEIEK